MTKRVKVAVVMALALVALGTAGLFVHNYQYLLRYSYGLTLLRSDNMSAAMRAYSIVGTAYDAALMTANSLLASVQTTEPSAASPLRTIELRLENGSLKKLVADLPRSAKERYYRGWLLYPDGNWRRIKYRLHGKSPFHWQVEKPSLRIKLRKTNPLGGLRHINLISPEDRPMVANIVADDMARSMGLLSHVSEMVRVFINGRVEGRYLGVYQLQTREDEAMLRANRRLPGPFFFGNDLNDRWEAKDFEVSGDDKVLADLPVHPLREMLAAIDMPLSLERYRRLWSVLDRDKYARWQAVSALVGSYHTDFHHNELFYYDPSTGRLEFVMNDANGHGMSTYPSTWRRLVRPWESDHRLPLNEMIQPLLDAALRDPRFLHARNLALMEALRGPGSVANQTRLLESYFRAQDADVAADADKGALEDTFTGVRRMPYSNSAYEEAKAQVVDWVRRRNTFLLDELGRTSVSAVVGRAARDGRTLVLLEVDGNSAVTFDTGVLGAPVWADKALDGTPGESVAGRILLHPGLREDTAYRYEHAIYVRRVPNHYLMPGVQRYLLAVAATPETVSHALRGAFVNAVTGAAVDPKIEWRGDIEPGAIQYNPVVLHPWRLPGPSTGDVVLGPGVVELAQDLVIEAGQRLVVRPGTEIRLGPKVSIASRGRVLMEGRTEAPITLRRLVADQAWGALVIQGEGANDSHIAYTRIAGGSIASHDNVAYSGMVNVHWADGFHLDHGTIANNVEGDDTLHIVHSRFVVADSDLHDCLADCIDLDYADGTIERTRITRAGNDGIDFMTSRVTVREVGIDTTGDKGLSVGEGSELTVAGGWSRGNDIGMAVKDASRVEVSDWAFEDDDKGLDVYEKNWRYGRPGDARLARTVFRGNKIDIRVAKKGRVLLDGVPVPAKVENEGELRAARSGEPLVAEPFAWRQQQWSTTDGWGMTP